MGSDRIDLHILMILMPFYLGEIDIKLLNDNKVFLGRSAAVGVSVLARFTI